MTLALKFHMEEEEEEEEEAVASSLEIRGKKRKEWPRCISQFGEKEREETKLGPGRIPQG